MGTDLKQNFNCISLNCMCGRRTDANKHFLLHCDQLYVMRRDLFRQLAVNGLDIRELNSNAQCNLLLFGSNDLTIVENRTIIEVTISFIKATKCLE